MIVKLSGFKNCKVDLVPRDGITAKARREAFAYVILTSNQTGHGISTKIYKSSRAQ